LTIFGSKTQNGFLKNYPHLLLTHFRFHNSWSVPTFAHVFRISVTNYTSPPSDQVSHTLNQQHGTCRIRPVITHFCAA